jgi:hypothetical protein
MPRGRTITVFINTTAAVRTWPWNRYSCFYE